MKFRLIALDPGGTTGWATFTADKMLTPDDTFEYLNPIWERGHIGPKPHHSLLNNFLGLQQTEEYVIICESFEFRQGSRPGLVLDSKEYIGIVKLFAEERKVKHVPQTAAMGKAFVKDKNIRRLALWYPGYKHAMDATRHLLYYMVQNRIMSDDLLERGWKE